MVNAVSNSTGSAQTAQAQAPTSPVLAFLNNATDASGAPIFAQAVRDALNKKTSSGAGADVPNGNTSDTDQIALPCELFSGSTPDSTPAPAAQSPKTGAVKLQPPTPTQNQAQATILKPSALNVAIVWPLNVMSVTAIPWQGADATSSKNADVSGDFTANAPASPSAVSGVAANVAPGGAALQPAALAQAGLTVDLASSDAATTDASSLNAVPTPRNAGTESTADEAKMPVNGSTDSSQPEVPETKDLPAANFTTLKAEVTMALRSLPSPAAVSGAVAPSSNPARSIPESKSLSVVAQQNQESITVANADGTATKNSPAVAALDSSQGGPETQQSQQVELAQKTSLASSFAEHFSFLNGTATATETKTAQSADAATRAAGTVQAPASGNHSANSSASHGDQNASGSPSNTDADTSAGPLPIAKAAASSFSDTLSAIPAQHSDPAPVPPITTGPAIVPQASGSAANVEISARSSNESLPSAPAQSDPQLATPHAADATPSTFVNNAQLTNAANQSEMRVAMQTDKLGAIELHARVSGDEIGAAIIVEKRDAHAALAVELPALQQTLSEKQLRVEQVVLTQGSLHSTAGDAGANAQNGQRGNQQSARFASASAWNEAPAAPTAAAWFVPEQTAIFDSQGRLSVQA
jgi:hypothetical protein